MAPEKHYLAIDLGAESGRGMLGTLSNGRIELSEIQRFQTGPVHLPTRYPSSDANKTRKDCSLVWDFLRFWQEIKSCMRQSRTNGEISSLGVDTWGVDFALLDKKGALIQYPYHYRDSRTDGMMEEAFKRLPRERIYEITGIQFMQLNTLFQLLAMHIAQDPALAIAGKLLMVPDLVNYWLTGKAVSEFTEATTSQILDTRKGEWSQEIIQAMGFPQHIFPEIIKPGARLGSLRSTLVDELGFDTTVVAPPTHDTGSAVAAIPAESRDYIWISSGTWSILGMNVPQPIINQETYANNFTNEGGVSGVYRFSKNITGLWIVQQCREQWLKEGQEFSYTELTQMAQKAPHLQAFIDPDFNEFLQMGNMVEKIRDYCRITDQPAPETKAEVIRAALQGLALRYRFVIEQLEKLSGRHASEIHIVGGGTKNQLLNQFTADALNRKVITGPIEATATGNIIVQAMAMGDVASWAEGVEIIKNSFDIQTYHPKDRTGWDEAYGLFKENLNKITLAF
jgi:rhamnulokinase